MPPGRSIRSRACSAEPRWCLWRLRTRGKRCRWAALGRMRHRADRRDCHWAGHTQVGRRREPIARRLVGREAGCMPGWVASAAPVHTRAVRKGCRRAVHMRVRELRTAAPRYSARLDYWRQACRWTQDTAARAHHCWDRSLIPLSQDETHRLSFFQFFMKNPTGTMNVA